jgi:hypothetical protein
MAELEETTIVLIVVHRREDRDRLMMGVSDWNVHAGIEAIWGGEPTAVHQPLERASITETTPSTDQP